MFGEGSRYITPCLVGSGIALAFLREGLSKPGLFYLMVLSDQCEQNVAILFMVLSDQVQLFTNAEPLYITKVGERMVKHSDWLSDEHDKLMELRQLHPEWSYQQLADALTDIYGMVFTFNAVRNRIRRHKPNNVKPVATGYKETVEILSDGSHKSDKLLQMDAEQCKDVRYLLKAHGYDVNAWELVSAKNNIWNVYSQEDGVQTLYSSKITVKPKQEEFSLDGIKEFFSQLSKDYQSPIHQPIQFKEDGKMLEINIADLHLNKLCWVGDSNDHYDEHVAVERFFYIINDVLTRTKDVPLNKILFIFSNDFFHVDNLIGTTTAGTRQDTVMRAQKMFKLGTKILVEAIDILSQYAPVETVYVGANHDKVFSYMASEYLYAWYRNNPHVEIDTDPKIRKYRRFGNSLILFSHGHAEKNRLGKIMPIEARKEWGETIYHECHAGHFHSEKAVIEDNGVIVRYLSSPTGSDNWHYESGYVGAVKKAQSFLWDKENGLELIINTPILGGEIHCGQQQKTEATE